MFGGMFECQQDRFADLCPSRLCERGEQITISFKTGDGLEAGKTKLKFKDVDIGVVDAVSLSPDHKRVVAKAEVTRDVSDLLVDNTRFWVVRPRISGGVQIPCICSVWGLRGPALQKKQSWPSYSPTHQSPRSIIRRTFEPNSPESDRGSYSSSCSRR